MGLINLVNIDLKFLKQIINNFNLFTLNTINVNYNFICFNFEGIYYSFLGNALEGNIKSTAPKRRNGSIMPCDLIDITKW